MSYFVESEHVFENQCGIIKGQFKMPRATISRCLHFILLIRLFFCQDRSKKSREKSYSRINRFLSRFSNMNKFYSSITLVKSSLHDHNRATLIVKSFLPKVISRSQLPQNTLKNCLGDRIRAWISITLASSKFFLLLLHELKNGENTTRVLLL